MTVIAAYMDDKRCVIGCDSMGTTSYVKYRVGSKLIHKGECSIGVCGDLRTIDIITEDEQLYEVFSIDSLRRFRDRLMELVPDVKTHESELLIVSNQGIFGIESNFALARIPRGYMAIGSGEELALGSMFNSRLMGDPAEIAVDVAVKAAVEYSKTCGYDVHLKSYDRRSEDD
jgi:ATP-dependent protease HslVU (ClpYQ) peptidase subunit